MQSVKLYQGISFIFHCWFHMETWVRTLENNIKIWLKFQVCILAANH